MGIQTQQRIAQTMQHVDVLIDTVRALSDALTHAEQQIKDLTQRLEKLEHHGPRQRQTARRD